MENISQRATILSFSRSKGKRDLKENLEHLMKEIALSKILVKQISMELKQKFGVGLANGLVDI
jgi:hypothetical protein